MICFKKFLFLLLIFIFLFCTLSFGAEVNNNPTSGAGGTIAQQNDNEFQTLMYIQQSVQNRFINALYAKKGVDTANANSLVQLLFTQFSSLGSNGKFLYFEENKKGYNDSNYLVYISYFGDLIKRCDSAYIYGNQAFPNTSVLSGTFYLIGGINADGCFSYNDYSRTSNKTIPFAFSCSISPIFPDLFKDFGFLRNAQLNSILSALITLHNDISSQVGQANIINDSINQQGNNIMNSIDKSTTDINNNLNNNDVSDVDTSGITNADTTVDITQDGFNRIFNTLQTYFTSNNGGSLTLTLPFVNKSITISKATVFGNFKQLSTIENYASLAWYFVISLYIVKSIQKMINKIKGGNLEDVVDNNVKADIL